MGKVSKIKKNKLKIIFSICRETFFSDGLVDIQSGNTFIFGLFSRFSVYLYHDTSCFVDYF